jgi:hypothetical protein
MTLIERDMSNMVKIAFAASADSTPTHCRGRYPLSIYSPTGGPTSVTLKKDSPAAAGTHVACNDADDAAITITLAANKWTNLSVQEQAAIMGNQTFVFTNGGGSTTAELWMETGT